MDRPKPAAGRGGKSKTPQFPSDLYILGPKGARAEGNETRRPLPVPVSTKPLPNPIADRRRIAGSTATVSSSVTPAAQPAKKPKLASTVLSRPSPFLAPNASQEPSKSWEQAATDIEPIDLVPTVMEAIEKNENEKIIALLCGSLKLLKASKMKSDTALTTGLLYLAKKHPSIFSRAMVVNALCSMLRRESSLMYKSKNTYTNAVLIVNLLFFGHQHIQQWPDIFLKMYIEDSLGERLWVDSDQCKCFVDNIMCSVNTTASPPFDPDTGARTDADEGIMSIIGEEHKEYFINNRYKGSEEVIENIVMDAVKDQLNRRQATEGISKYFLKFLCSMCGLTEVRATAASKLEVWLTNPKLKSNAKELLMAVCVNSTSNTPKDVDIVASIVKIKLKMKDLHAFYLACIRELIPAHDNNLSTVLGQIVSSELFAARNQNYVPMLMFSTLFQADPDQLASILAKIFLEYLTVREDNLRALRGLLREVNKVLRADLDLQAFVRGLMHTNDAMPADFEFKDRLFASIADLIAMSIFLAISLHARTDRKDPSQVHAMQQLVASIEGETVRWFLEYGFQMYKPPAQEFMHALYKVVFMEPAENYYRIDNWPPEQDRALFIRSAAEVPLLQQTVLDILRIGLSKEHPFSCADALELVEQLVRRACALAFTLSIPVLPADDLEIVDLLFNISTYRQPESTELPADYNPPNLAVSSSYWKSWIILLIYCAHVPSVFGVLAWEKYPTLRVFIEMCITNNFVFPVTSDEQQAITKEKQEIVAYETYLAKTTITETSSLLLSQLITMAPSGPARRPPTIILDHLQMLNNTLKIGQLLCRSRNPDFLLDIIRKQGSSQSMPWLADLVQKSEGSFNHLPVQCLCEFLLSSTDKQERYQQLLTHLQSLLTDPKRNPNVVCEILDHFLRRFSSHTNKEQAILGLKLLLSSHTEEEMETDQAPNHGELSTWILNKLPSIPHFESARPQIVRALREACQIENDPDLITSYLTFLAQHVVASNSDLLEMSELVLDMAQLIVERSTIMTAILPSVDETDESANAAANVALTALLKIFSTYLSKAREARLAEYVWPEGQEMIVVMWPSGERATLYTLVIHAIIILLTYKVDRDTRAYLYFESLLNMWFPVMKELKPKAYLVDSNQIPFTIPDWLKLRMIRSDVPRLLEEALTGLEPAQLLLFIQSFGIPVKSMSTLLKTLDLAISQNKINLDDVALDKRYMIQLVEVQHNRGAKGGIVFANALKQLDPEMPLPESPLLDMKVIKSEPLEEDHKKPVSRVSDEEINQIIENMGSLKPKIISQTKKKLLQMLSTELVCSAKSSSYPARTLKKVVAKLLRKCTVDTAYVNELVRNYHYPSILFRLLTTCSNNQLGPLVVVAKSVLECRAAVEKPRNPLVVTLRTFLNKNNYSEITAKLKKQAEVSKQSSDVFEGCSIDQLERTGNYLMESAMRKAHGAKSVVETVAGLITRCDKMYKNASGLFIDWLVQIEPEILGSSLELQMDMLFSQKFDEKWESVQVCRPYLLTLLTHHASWFTLETALSKLLTLEATEKYDPTAVLEFLWAVARNPRLWQGRELVTPKKQEPVDVLDLTEQELICVVEYIVLEVEFLGCNEKGLSRMSHRLSQLVECVINTRNTNIMISIIKHLDKESSVSELRKQICQNVIAHIYLRVPRITNLLKDMQLTIEFDKISKADRDSSILDVMSHAVLTSFTTNSQIREAPKRTLELELILRKMCSTHPRLILRQIKIIETSLMGRIYLDWPAFRKRNNPSFFQQIFGILELLQPHLFAHEFESSFHSILDVYLNLFKTHGGWKEIDSLMPRLVTLSQNYLSHDIKRAISFFQGCSALIRDLATDHPCLGSLCILMAGAPDSSSNKEFLIPALACSVDNDTPPWDNMISAFIRDGASALVELDHVSHRKPMLVEPLLERLIPFLHDRSANLRSVAHLLLMKCLKHNPKTASRIMPAVFDCLHADRPDVVESACECLPELIICCQGLKLLAGRSYQYSSAFRTYLGVFPQITNWSSAGDEFSLIFDSNPPTEFVELPYHCLNLKYSNILAGVLRGACEMVEAMQLADRQYFKHQRIANPLLVFVGTK